MKIVVYDIAASSGGGGEIILNQYYHDAINDVKNEWWFFVSIDDKYQEYDHVHIIMLERRQTNKLINYFNRFINRRKIVRALKDIGPDRVISLQNMVSPGHIRNQTVYLHQSLQFSPVRFHFYKREERSLAFRQKIICCIIRLNLPKADEVIVQTQWMKEATARWAHYPEDQIKVISPRVFVPELFVAGSVVPNHFVYPCNGNIYKNHNVLIEACKLLKQRGLDNYQVDLTISPDANSLTKRLSEQAKAWELPINFIGHLSREALFRKYTEAVVLFPSYIETFGLPLLEAKKMNSTVIASDLPFAHEVLGGYEKAQFVRYDSPELWADAMMASISSAEEQR